MADLPATPTYDADGVVRADVLIVGAGVAGLFAATQLPAGLDIVVIDKGTPTTSGSSPLAAGGMAAPFGPDDSPELHAADTLRAGDGLCDATAVGVLTREAVARVEQLMAMGAAFDRTAAGDLHLAREGGQSVSRSVHKDDATGAEMVRALRAAARGRVTRIAGTVAELARDASGRVAGVHIVTADGPVLATAPAVLLATGGAGGLFAATTNRDSATGDGVALAYLAGAAVRDQEFTQFHPTGLAVTGNWRLLLTEALRGAGATLIDADGRRFMPDLHPDAELAPRHIVAKAILDQPGTVFLDATHLGRAALEHEFPTVLAGVARYGFDLATQPVPVTPAAHYMVGGVRTDLHTRTSLPGLYAAGEVASTGVHGANRMAGNSLIEALVFGARAADAIAADRAADRAVLDGLPAIRPRTAPDLTPLTATDEQYAAIRERLRSAMWAGCGPVRDAARLADTSATLDALADEVGAGGTDVVQVELHLAIVTAKLMVRSALNRTESRGGHWRLDHPARDERWASTHLEHIRPGG